MASWSGRDQAPPESLSLPASLAKNFPPDLTLPFPARSGPEKVTSPFLLGGVSTLPGCWWPCPLLFSEGAWGSGPGLWHGTACGALCQHHGRGQRLGQGSPICGWQARLSPFVDGKETWLPFHIVSSHHCLRRKEDGCKFASPCVLLLL